MRKKLEEADIILANGGNPENYAIALHFVDAVLAAAAGGKTIFEVMRTGVQTGKKFWTGRSAGAMVAVGPMLTLEPFPWMRKSEV